MDTSHDSPIVNGDSPAFCGDAASSSDTRGSSGSRLRYPQKESRSRKARRQAGAILIRSLGVKAERRGWQRCRPGARPRGTWKPCCC
ncbi:hypothetical protein NDU88_009174, partial [Pleurodeles waltl]